MQKLLEFLVGKRHWLLFILCEIISFTFLYRYNAYQRNVFLSSANVVTGHISSVSNSVLSYIKLRDENKILFEQNGLLELEILDLRQQLETIKSNQLSYDSVMTDSIINSYEFITAGVVNNSVTRLSNYITIDKGYKDGVRPDMGVISTHGVVGIVAKVSDYFTVVIPLLNPKLILSCKLKKGNYYGSLSWDGRDAQYATLEELPTHSEYQEGDTVVTSGYSAVFPPGVIVGTVAKSDKPRDYNFYSLKVKLSTDFQGLKNVRVVKNSFQQERLEIEQEAQKND